MCVYMYEHVILSVSHRFDVTGKELRMLEVSY